jgi:hypothetical protein
MAVAGSALLLAACSSSSSVPPPQGAAPSTSGASGSAPIDALTASLKKGKSATYLATYQQTSGGQASTWTVAQAPPKSLFSYPGGSLITTGSQSLFCSTSSGSTSCVAGGPNIPSIASLTTLIDPSSVISALDSYAGRIASRIVKITATSSSKTIAGQPSQCVSISIAGSQAGTWCANSDGVVTEAQAGTGGGITMTSYTTDVPASTFEVPAGATVQTLPSVG